MSDGPLPLYREKRRKGELKPDPNQEIAAEKLQSLHNAIKRYVPEGSRRSWKARLGLGGRNVDPPQGLYIFGGVGTGKSMLMDLFYTSAEVGSKRRVHFHAFMQDVHERLHRWRKDTKGARADPLPEVAREIAGESWLLCFDEFHVVNIADAMILSRLFQSLFDLGVVVIVTSNWPPERLYEGGLQRDRFVAFIDLLKERLDVLMLDSGIDYRLDRLRTMAVYHAPLGRHASAELDRAFAALTDGAEAQPESITFKGRRIAVPAASRGVARFSFRDLCERPLGAGDYLAIASRYHTILVEDVPRLGRERLNEAERFIALIDALYEHRVKLVISAEAEPERLYPEGKESTRFRRTASRLQEMRSAAYLELPHLT